jgi:hypothetical protein
MPRFYESLLIIKTIRLAHIHQNRPRNATYMEFMETHPLVFAKVKEPLEANEWLQVIEQKFGLI